MVDAEAVLRESPAGTFFLYKDFETDKLYLSVRFVYRIVVNSFVKDGNLKLRERCLLLFIGYLQRVKDR